MNIVLLRNEILIAILALLVGVSIYYTSTRVTTPPVSTSPPDTRPPDTRPLINIGYIDPTPVQIAPYREPFITNSPFISLPPTPIQRPISTLPPDIKWYVPPPTSAPINAVGVAVQPIVNIGTVGDTKPAYEPIDITNATMKPIFYTPSENPNAPLGSSPATGGPPPPINGS